MPKTIAIVGPESSGKTQLSKELAQLLSAPLVEEFAREYLSILDRQYQFSDLNAIAAGQLNLESQARKNADLVISDTNLMHIEVWAEIRFQKNLDPQDSFNESTYYLLTKPDLPYEYDPLREHPKIEDRVAIFDYFYKKLKDNNKFLGIVEGFGKERLNNAKKLLDSQLSL